jgi:membrane-associated phospholipid phosphatase
MHKHGAQQSFLSRWRRVQIIYLGVGLLSLSVLSIFYVDQPLTRWVHGTFRGELDKAASIVTWFGLGDGYFLISVCGYLLARMFSTHLTHLSWRQRSEQARGRFAFMFLSFAISGALVLTLKSIFGRCRPYHSPDFLPLNFRPFTFDWNYQSYPSGHTQVGFTLATFLAVLYPKGTKWFYLLAALIGISRVVLEKHYLGDVLAGAYVGILGTYLAFHWHGRSLLKRQA